MELLASDADVMTQPADVGRTQPNVFRRKLLDASDSNVRRPNKYHTVQLPNFTNHSVRFPVCASPLQTGIQFLFFQRKWSFPKKRNLR